MYKYISKDSIKFFEVLDDSFKEKFDTEHSFVAQYDDLYSCKGIIDGYDKELEDSEEFINKLDNQYNQLLDMLFDFPSDKEKILISDELTDFFKKVYK